MYTNETYLALQMINKLWVTPNDIRPVLDEARKRPQSQFTRGILLYDIEMGVVRTATHLSGLCNDSVDALREGVLQKR